MAFRLLFSIPAVALAVFTGSCSSTDDAGRTAPAPETGVGMESWTPPAPGPEHAWLARMEGRWAVESKFRMSPEMPWSEYSAVETVETVAGGFWILSTQTADFEGMPYEGRLLLGYDQLKGKYSGAWIDSFGSWMTPLEGERHAGSDTLATRCLMLDGMKGVFEEVHMTTRIVDDNRIEFEMHKPAPEGGRYLAMVQTSRRIQ